MAEIVSLHKTNRLVYDILFHMSLVSLDLVKKITGLAGGPTV
jgi:hypothetical protein